MEIDLDNRQRRERPEMGPLGALVLFLATQARRRVPSRDRAWDRISVILVDDLQIRRIKQRYFGPDEVTDVIALPYRHIPGSTDAVAGEVFINIARARLLGRRFGGPAREFALYIAHGLDHLTGATDGTARTRRRMRRRELRWVALAAQQGLLSGIFSTVSSKTKPQVLRHA